MRPTQASCLHALALAREGTLNKKSAVELNFRTLKKIAASCT